MLEHLHYITGFMLIVSGLYCLIGSFVSIYIKGADYRLIDVIYNFLFTFVIAWGFSIIHYCK